MVKGICKENLDKKICDCEDCDNNNSTYREFIRESEYFFGLEPQKLDTFTEFTDEELIQYLDWIDVLWDK